MFVYVARNQNEINQNQQNIIKKIYVTFPWNGNQYFFKSCYHLECYEGKKFEKLNVTLARPSYP